MSKKYIFDLGSYDCSEGLMFALLNPDHIIYCFEANPYQCKIIEKNIKIIESKYKKKINNLNVLNVIVGNKNLKKCLFYISENPIVSSLYNFKKNVFKNWPGFQIHFKHKKKIKIEQIKLSSFCDNYQINNISYIHSDIQGNDLNAFIGLACYIYKVKSCKLEISLNRNSSIYQKEKTYKDCINFFAKKKFHVDKVKIIPRTFGNQMDIFLKSNKFFDNNISFDYKFSNYLQKIFLNKNTFIDHYINFFLYHGILFLKKFDIYWKRH